MELKNKKIIYKMATHNILDEEVVTEAMEVTDDDVILLSEDNQIKTRAITNNITNEEALLLVELKQLDMLKSIKGMVKFFFVCGIISLILTALFVLPTLISV